MKQYLAVLERALSSPARTTRNGVVRSYFGENFTIDCSCTLPLVTTKKLHFKSIAYELLFFLKAKPRENVSTAYLTDNGVSIWREWTRDDGTLGPVYGAQWARQLPGVINDIIHSPNSRRLLVSSWQMDDIDSMALPPCHLYYQFYVNDGDLDLSFTMRSTDVFLGLPYNIASYGMLLHIVALITGLRPGKLHVNLNDVHLYENHVEQAVLQLSRTPYYPPDMDILAIKTLEDYEYKDFQLNDYIAHPHIKAEVSK